MTKSAIIAEICRIGLVPIIRTSSPDDALHAMDAICAGGVSVLELTMTVPGAIPVLEQVKSKFGDSIVLGAGTVLDPETARACILAGAQFIVSPALNLDTLALCRRYGIPIMPGALTPTEVVTAWQSGADLVKVFPCNSVGGASYIKSLKAPLPQIDLIPTGGVNLKTAADFIRAGSAALGVGADLVDTKAIADGNLSAITDKAKQFVQIVAEARQA
jgi:2-dehydro-3-deoxyphosphogluconate aldolase/(4S)-4-hydroxy-2-oxoglutarate aldolase